VAISDDTLPDEFQAKNLYEQHYTGSLTDEHPFGFDPLADHEDLKNRRNNDFFQQFNIQTLFQECTHGRTQPIKNAVMFFIEKTFELAQNL